MTSKVHVDIDVDAELAMIERQFAVPVAELGAAFIAAEIRAAITISEFPAASGEPPHSTGPYRDSWKHGKARRRRDVVTANAYSRARADNGEALAIVLDEGRGPIEPHPHLSLAVERAARRLKSLI